MTHLVDGDEIQLIVEGYVDRSHDGYGKRPNVTHHVLDAMVVRLGRAPCMCHTLS